MITPTNDNKPAQQATKAPGDGYVQSFARGLTVIKTFNAQNPEQTLTEVARAADLTRAGARRILLTLVHLGYVENEGRLFRLTPKILDLGFAYLTSMPFWNLAEPVMEALVDKIAESTSVAVLDETEIVYVLRVPAKKIMTVSLSIGSRLPALWTSLGRVLLSGKTNDELRLLIANTPAPEQSTARTILDPDALLAELIKVRRQGWAVVEQELDEGLISMAAPIRDRQGRIIAAINISGNAQRRSIQEMKDGFLDLLLDAAEHISMTLLRR